MSGSHKVLMSVSVVMREMDGNSESSAEIAQTLVYDALANEVDTVDVVVVDHEELNKHIHWMVGDEEPLAHAHESDGPHSHIDGEVDGEKHLLRCAIWPHNGGNLDPATCNCKED